MLCSTQNGTVFPSDTVLVHLTSKCMQELEQKKGSQVHILLLIPQTSGAIATFCPIDTNFYSMSGNIRVPFSLVQQIRSPVTSCGGRYVREWSGATCPLRPKQSGAPNGSCEAGGRKMWQGQPSHQPPLSPFPNFFL